MNLVEQIIEKRVTQLLFELEALTAEVIADGQRKAKSTAIADLMSQKELDPELARKMAMIHLQLTLLMNMTGAKVDG